MGYDAWLEKPYQDQCALEEAVSHEIDEYRSEKRFMSDAREWAIKKGLNPDALEDLELDYLESSECYEYCEWRVEERKGDVY